MTDYTWPAWTDSNRDYFERNLLFTDWLGAEANAAAEFVPNNLRPTWPTLDEVTRWAQSVNDYPGMSGTAVNVENLQLCLDAAIERIATRTHFQVHPLDVGGGVDYGTLGEVPADVKLATIMTAARWADRARTITGIAGSSEITGLIRTSSFDPDVESLLAPWLSLGLY